jgi:molecular chaperone DnaJ
LNELGLKKLPDYYTILKVKYGDPIEIIKKTYRELAKIYHPDNQKTGSKEEFNKVHSAYKMLTGFKRNIYDNYYEKYYLKPNKDFIERADNFLNNKKIPNRYVHLPQNRIIYTTSLVDLARLGLLKSGMRTKERKVRTGMFHDIEILIKKNEAYFRLMIDIPLTVRILCPNCFGSDIFCESCNGIGTYKSTRLIHLTLKPENIKNGIIYNLDLSKFRPDKFIHFKKKNLKIRIHILNQENPDTP